MIKTTVAGVLAAAALAAQTYPGQPTQARVHVENRGATEAIPVTVHQAAADAALRVQVIGTHSVSVAAPVDVRHMRQTWEYQRLLVRPDEDVTGQLNSLGAAGWETTLQYAEPRGSIVIVLKRLRQ